MKKNLLALTTVGIFSIVQTSCGVQTSHESTVENNVRPSAFALRPDLLFTASLVEVTLPSGIRIGVPPGSRVLVPCNATHVNITYQYKNAGALNAQPHRIIGSISGTGSGSGQAVPSLAGGQSRTLTIMISLSLLPANHLRKLSLRLDTQNEVIEANETNNTLVMTIFKRCN